jgi:hypothetical protein
MQTLAKLIPVVPSITTVLTFGAFSLLIFAILSSVLRKQFTPSLQRNVLAAMALVFLAFLLNSVIQSKNAAEYRLHVLLVDQHGRMCEEGTLTASVRSVLSRSPSGWDVEISPTALPSDHRVQLYAKSRDGFMAGKADLSLDSSDRTPSVSIQLAEDESGKVSGVVTDSRSGGLGGVRIFLVGQEAAATNTDSDGRFSIAAHLPDGEEIEIHAELSGYEPKIQTHWVGKTAAYIVLNRK